ncbi:glycoside hydrolase family 117 protein [Pelagicoccus mobilis]|uniref:Family 43 glycosylhydrolase n=1 Tax=Pelagicoccus mobilis TaxID=415221 RepID=A0A934RW22_9BACT|nr:family 43 glycosylhydrolase [Pelagicoccus mobilis]MBK1877541.1 family 43 glycosylhydrolase [Pelagicoccus mobilis]
MKKLLGIMAVVSASMGLNAENGSPDFSGVVKNAETGEVIKNVRVADQNGEEFDMTDSQGRFSFSVDGAKPRILVFENVQYLIEEKEASDFEGGSTVELRPRKMSAATARWLEYLESEEAYNTLNFSEEDGWEIEFEEENLKGDLAPDPDLVRRDPSAVIKVDDLYYVYYTRGTRVREDGSEKFFPWDECDLWYATSKDGWEWKEMGPAVERGPAGSYDEQSVFTPEVLAHDGKFYLVYQCVVNPYVHRVKETVAMAVADSPNGPWRKSPKPILEPVSNGKWDPNGGDADILRLGNFDSHKTHDPCLMFYRDKFYLYYKGERIGEQRIFGQREIKWGVAIAENPEGPYVRSEYNPITNSGHEVCVWHYNGGIALIHTDDGPERHTVQWAPDGINFEITGRIGKTPKAFGLYRGGDHDKKPTEGIRWGLCHRYGGGFWRTSYNYIRRFDVKE